MCEMFNGDVEGVDRRVREKQSVTRSYVCFGQLNGNNNGGARIQKGWAGC